MPIIKNKTKSQELFWWRKKRGERSRNKRSLRLKARLKMQMNKRRRFVIVALLLTGGLLIIQRLPVEMRGGATIVLGLASYLLSMWSLRLDLVGVAWLVDLILPTLYPMSVALFYFLLPQLMVTRIIMMLVFAVSMYALLLTANIFAVATNRTIQLLRAARTVGFLLSIMTATLIYHVIFSLNLSLLWVSVLSGLISFIVFLQGVWGYTLNVKLDQKEVLYSLIGSIIMSEMTLAITFWSVEPLMASVMLSMMTYVFLGLFQQDIDKRLFKKTIQEYVWFAAIVYLVVVSVVFSRWMA